MYDSSIESLAHDAYEQGQPESVAADAQLAPKQKRLIIRALWRLSRLRPHNAEFSMGVGRSDLTEHTIATNTAVQSFGVRRGALGGDD